CCRVLPRSVRLQDPERLPPPAEGTVSLHAPPVVEISHPTYRDTSGSARPGQLHVSPRGRATNLGLDMLGVSRHALHRFRRRSCRRTPSDERTVSAVFASAQGP